MLEQVLLAQLNLSRFHVPFFEDRIRDTGRIWESVLVEDLGTIPVSGYNISIIHHFRAVSIPVVGMPFRFLEPFPCLRRTVGRTLNAMGLRGRVRAGLCGNVAPLGSASVSEEAREIIGHAGKSDMKRLSGLLGVSALPRSSSGMSA